jgi:hypothetical protein
MELGLRNILLLLNRTKPEKLLITLTILIHWRIVGLMDSIDRNETRNCL